MDSLLAIGVGLVLRVIVDYTTDNDNKVGGVLVGLWEGVVLNHFVRRMPRSFDPYLGFGFRIFVDFLFTQSLSRLALVALWSLVGMLLADVAPNIWRDSGLRHLYRQVYRDVRRVKRFVPRIRIKNDLPSVRIFSRTRSASSEVGSVRSDRAVPSRSAAPSPAPSPSRRPGRSPPGTLPDVSGWSETNTDLSNIRTRVVTDPGSSPALIPSREHEAYEHTDTTHIATSQAQTTTIQNITITQTQSESVVLDSTVEATALGAAAVATPVCLIDDPSRHDPPTIPDDWIDVTHPTPARNEPSVTLQIEPGPPSEPQPGPPSPTPSRPASIVVHPPPIDILPNIPDAEVSNISRLPESIPLPESRAASVIGGIYDQPEPRNALRDSFRARVGKATSEIGIDTAKSFTPVIDTQAPKLSRTRWQSKLSQSVGIDVPEPPPKEAREVPIKQAKLDVGSAAQGPETQVCTPAQVDPPPSILTQPGDALPLLLAPEPQPTHQQEPLPKSEPERPPPSAGVDQSPGPPPKSEVEKGDNAGPGDVSLFDLPALNRTPPPPFTEFAGVPDSVAAGDGPAAEDPLTQDEEPVELTEEQKAIEEKRQAFLVSQMQELEGSHADLQKKLDREDDPTGSPANAIESDMEDAGKTLASIKARLKKKKFSQPPVESSIKEISVSNKSVMEVQYAVTSAILEELLACEDAGPLTIQVTINKQKLLKAKAKDAKEAIMALVKLHKFAAQWEPGTPGVINITI